jgi:cytochrome P450
MEVRADSVDVPLEAVARLSDPAFYVGDPFPAFARLRNEAPVFFCEDGGFWALSRYDDVRAVGRNTDGFSSAQGVVVVDRESRGRTKRDHLPEGSVHLMQVDPPLHTKLRRLVASAFTPAAVRALEPMVRGVVQDVLDGIEPGTTTNVVDVLSAPIPIYVLAALFGVPQSMWSDFRRWSDSIVQQLDVVDPDEKARHAANIGELYDYFREECESRRREPRGDLLSMLATGTVDGQELSINDVLVYCMMLTVAGNETTRNTITGGVRALGLHRDQRALMIDEPARTTASSQEILRWVSPVQAFARTATRDVVIRDQLIAEGDFVLMLYPSANRDEAVWTRADEFDVTRPSDPPHLAFGFGPHRCLGAGLAELEIDVVFDELLRRFPNYELAGEAKSIPGTLVYMLEELPVEFK